MALSQPVFTVKINGKWHLLLWQRMRRTQPKLENLWAFPGNFRCTREVEIFRCNKGWQTGPARRFQALEGYDKTLKTEWDTLVKSTDCCLTLTLTLSAIKHILVAYMHGYGSVAVPLLWSAQRPYQCLRQRANITTSKRPDRTSNRTFSCSSRHASALQPTARGCDCMSPLCARSRWLSTVRPFHMSAIQRVIDRIVSESADSRTQSGSQSSVPFWSFSLFPGCQRLASRPPEARLRYNLSVPGNKRGT